MELERIRLGWSSQNIVWLLTFLLDETFVPSIVIWVDTHDLIISPLLDLRQVCQGSDAHDQVSRDCVKTGTDHGQTNRLDLSWDVSILIYPRDTVGNAQHTFIQLSFWIFEDVASNARLVRAIGNFCLQGRKQLG